MTRRWQRSDHHPDLITPMRERLRSTGQPYVIENVPGAPLVRPVTLCGSMFGLMVRRHRLFETNWPLSQPPCAHSIKRVIGVYGHPGGSSRRDGLTFPAVADWSIAMQIGWMSGEELAQAIPPAYTEWIGTQLMAYLTVAR